MTTSTSDHDMQSHPEQKDSMLHEALNADMQAGLSAWKITCRLTIRVNV